MAHSLLPFLFEFIWELKTKGPSPCEQEPSPNSICSTRNPLLLGGGYWECPAFSLAALDGPASHPRFQAKCQLDISLELGVRSNEAQSGKELCSGLAFNFKNWILSVLGQLKTKAFR